MTSKKTDADEIVEPAAVRAAELAAFEAKSDAELVAERTADTDKGSSTEHVKVFVIPGDEPKPTKSNYNHDANIAAVRQYMMSQGLRPTGDVVFKKSEPYGPGGKSWALTYAVPAVPAERFDFQPVGVLDQQDDETSTETEASTGAETPAT